MIAAAKKTKDKFLKGFSAFENYSNNQLGKSFTDATAAERGKILTELGAQKDKDKKDDAAQFYSTVKSLTIQAYTSSQFYLTKVQVYELVPGRYHGCVPVKAGA
jgi:hypothetical protein